jgi:prephenate dehydrogenase
MTACNRICLVGVDGIVGSFVLGLKRTGYRGGVVGVADSATIQRAWELKVVTDGTDDLAKAVKGSNLVIMSRQAVVQGQTLRQVLSQVDPGTIVSEMTRVKGDVNQIFAELKRDDVHYVGFRLAGDADVSLDLLRSSPFFYEHKTVILTPRGKADLDAFALLQDSMKRMGAAVVAMSPQAHDRMLADLNQIPRLAMIAAVEYVMDPARGVPLDAASLGSWLTEQLRELQQMVETGWAHDVEANREPVLAALSELPTRIATLQQAIREGKIADHLNSLAGDGGRLANPVSEQSGSTELVLSVGRDTKLLEKVAHILAESKIPVASMNRMHDAEVGTFCLTLNSPLERARAAMVLKDAGVPITEIQ